MPRQGRRSAIKDPFFHGSGKVCPTTLVSDRHGFGWLKATIKALKAVSDDWLRGMELAWNRQHIKEKEDEQCLISSKALIWILPAKGRNVAEGHHVAEGHYVHAAQVPLSLLVILILIASL